MQTGEAVQGIVALSSIPVGSSVSATTRDAEDILITRTGQNSVVAFSAICTHMGCTVASNFHCPCHGSFYDPKTGARLGGPAPSGLPTHAVRVSAGQVVDA